MRSREVGSEEHDEDDKVDVLMPGEECGHNSLGVRRGNPGVFFIFLLRSLSPSRKSGRIGLEGLFYC